MNGFKILLPLAAAALMMSACSSDETIEDIKTSNAIAFNVLSDNNLVTRGTPTTPSNLTSTDFEVWAFTNGTTSEAYMGGANDGVQITHSTTSTTHSADATSGYGTGYWDYKNTDEIAYWPSTGTLDFYAINPSHDTKSVVAPNVSTDAKSFTYYADNVNTNQVDVMYAVATGQSKSPVTLNFKHALSQIVFNGNVARNGLKATVEKIVLHNISNGGTCTFTSTSSTWADATSTATKDYTATLSTTEISYNNSTNTDLTASADPLLLKPQQLSEDANVGIGEATTTEPTSGAYLEVSYKLQDSKDHYLKGSADKYEQIYVPLTGTWSEGNKYVYSLSFDANVITFTCTVTDWTKQVLSM